ncbi:MAG: hypothetical protein KIH63_004785 [Candidatus Saccharibacteria bacterium]|nr:hypothetical protein [Candidatus Saccharibacteria bacterium]
MPAIERETMSGDWKPDALKSTSRAYAHAAQKERPTIHLIVRNVRWRKTKLGDAQINMLSGPKLKSKSSSIKSGPLRVRTSGPASLLNSPAKFAGITSRLRRTMMTILNQWIYVGYVENIIVSTMKLRNY